MVLWRLGSFLCLCDSGLYIMVCMEVKFRVTCRTEKQFLYWPWGCLQHFRPMLCVILQVEASVTYLHWREGAGHVREWGCVLGPQHRWSRESAPINMNYRGFSTLISEWISVGLHTLSHPLSTFSPKKLMVLPMLSVHFTCRCLQCPDINQSHDWKSLVLGNKFCLILQAHPAFWSSLCMCLTLLMRWKQFHILWSFLKKNKVRKMNEGTRASLSVPPTFVHICSLICCQFCQSNWKTTLWTRSATCLSGANLERN